MAVFKPTPILREKRRSRSARLTLADAAGNPIEIVARDVSSRGLRAIATRHAPECGDMVEARLGDGRTIWGVVRWREGCEFGIEFDTRPADGPS